jgi:hypothetical protein
MGDATPPKEHILILLPLPISQELLDGIKKKHPNTTIKYHFLDLKAVFAGAPPNVPDGILPITIYLATFPLTIL